MRQLTCTGPRRIEWREVPEPRLQGDREALVRPLAAARCEIDPFLISGLIPSQGPFALGHESVAEVVALGEALGVSVGWLLGEEGIPQAGYRGENRGGYYRLPIMAPTFAEPCGEPYRDVAI